MSYSKSCPFWLKIFLLVVFKDLFFQPKLQLKRTNGSKVMIFGNIKNFDKKLKNLSQISFFKERSLKNISECYKTYSATRNDLYTLQDNFLHTLH